MSPRVKIDGVHGDQIHPICVRRDRIDPTRVFYRGPSIASLTQDQAIDLANTLADLLDEMRTDG